MILRPNLLIVTVKLLSLVLPKFWVLFYSLVSPKVKLLRAPEYLVQKSTHLRSISIPIEPKKKKNLKNMRNKQANRPSVLLSLETEWNWKKSSLYFHGKHEMQYDKSVYLNRDFTDGSVRYGIWRAMQALYGVAAFCESIFTMILNWIMHIINIKYVHFICIQWWRNNFTLQMCAWARKMESSLR